VSGAKAMTYQTCALQPISRIVYKFSLFPAGKIRHDQRLPFIAFPGKILSGKEELLLLERGTARISRAGLTNMGGGKGAVLDENHVVPNALYLLPTYHQILISTEETKDFAGARDYQSPDPSSLQIDVHIHHIAKLTAITDVYHFTGPKF